jgi:adenylate cyclase, class 2
LSASPEPPSPATDMKPPHEVEIKLPIGKGASLRALKRRLKELGFRVAEARRRERNQLFDFPDGRLRRAHCLLRLRTEKGRCQVTFKGAPARSRRYKVRSEIEVEVSEGDRLAAIFAGLGLRPAFRYEKYRTTYRRPREAKAHRQALVELDETPIGNFLELEGPPAWIDRVARALGYQPRDYVTSSYAALYFQACRARGRRPTHMLFGAPG